MSERSSVRHEQIDRLYRAIEGIGRPGQRRAARWFTDWTVGDRITAGVVARGLVAPYVALWSWWTEERDR